MQWRGRWRQGLLLFILLFLPGPFSVAAADRAITIVAENDWFPYASDQDGQPVGMAVDLVRAAFAAAGAELELVIQPYARCLEGLELGRQAGCFNTIREPANEARFLFHAAPLFSARILIVAPADSTASGLGPLDLEGQAVAVTNGYTYDEPFQSSTRVDKDVASSDLAVLRLVALKRVPYGVIYEQVMAHLMSQHGGELAGNIKVVGVLSQPDLYVSFSRIHPDTPRAIAALDRGLALIRADGTYDEITRRWATQFNLVGGN
ncbi:amino acid ABC transporter substrate-binding protein (PAAT family) [Dongia mobilis]|uniref:Amino acid ABC transporter substrate-binding protein (PAAT family) n=1 Tax=Dongia mobilis TaxID=578943 RepID=A0A4V3DEM2_9PROT|nr:amino acid ABC transporter substrate-binding protein (PAAT family) [Dongia mobilis]